MLLQTEDPDLWRGGEREVAKQRRRKKEVRAVCDCESARRSSSSMSQIYPPVHRRAQLRRRPHLQVVCDCESTTVSLPPLAVCVLPYLPWRPDLRSTITLQSHVRTFPLRTVARASSLGEMSNELKKKSGSGGVVRDFNLNKFPIELELDSDEVMRKVVLEMFSIYWPDVYWSFGDEVMRTDMNSSDKRRDDKSNTLNVDDNRELTNDRGSGDVVREFDLNKFPMELELDSDEVMRNVVLDMFSIYWPDMYWSVIN